MDFVIVGTAGHIDHGKTALVKALTGTDTDRTREERERGISIDLGFAPLVLGNGRRLGVVDVPGHERFIRNMLAGAGGIDLILLVIDAREGVMPQTREHLAILQMLDVSSGIVVITKIDLVDAEWLELVREEVAAELRGTFLATAPMVHVSAVTGAGVEELKSVIEGMLPLVRPKPRAGPLRLPIDRVFSVPGIGTVVTGTIWRGDASVGDSLQVWPGGETARVRSVQVHGEAVETAVAGQRAAVALAGVKAEIRRGMALSAPGALSATMLLDARVRVLPDAPFALSHRLRVRFYTGTAETIGRVLLLDGAHIAPGGDALVQVSLEQQVAVEARDHFVLRSYSPMHTIGGGQVIDPHPGRNHRRHSPAILERLRRKESGTPSERTLDALTAKPGANAHGLAAVVGESEETVEQALRDLLAFGAAKYVGQPPVLASMHTVRLWKDGLRRAVEGYYQKNRYDVWVPRSVAQNALKALGAESRLAEAVIADAAQHDDLDVQADRLRTKDRRVALSSPELEVKTKIEQAFSEHPFAPPGLSEMDGWFKGRERMVRNILHLLIQEDAIIAIGPDMYASAHAVARSVEAAQQLGMERGGFAVADFRDRIGTSRKFAVAVLEYLDRQKITRRNGDTRECL
ncbi:MAG: selenocysteine-specific translation elongation factor [Bacilli bacterium]